MQHSAVDYLEMCQCHLKFQVILSGVAIKGSHIETMYMHSVGRAVL